MSFQASIDAYFKKISTASPGTNKKHKVMKRHSLSLLKPPTPVKLTKIDEDVTIMENIVTTVDLSSDDESPTKTEPTSNSQVPPSNVDPSSLSMTTNQDNLTPKTPIKPSKCAKLHENMQKNDITAIDSDDESTPSTKTESNCNKHKDDNCKKDFPINDLNINLSQPPFTDDNPSHSSMKSSLRKDVPSSPLQFWLSDANSSNSSSSTILYTLTPPQQTPEKTHKIHNFKSPSNSAKKYYSPNKKRPVPKISPAKRSPMKRNLANDFSAIVSEDEEYNKACEGMDNKTIFLLSIVNKCVKDDALKRLLDQETNDILNRILSAKKPGARIICRLYWRQTEWYRTEQIKQLCTEKKNEGIDDSTFVEMLKSLVENKLITSSNDNDIMTFEDYVKVLKSDELKQICKDLKTKHGSKQECIENLRSFSRRSSISKYFTTLKNGNASYNNKRVLDIMKTKAGPCFKLSDRTKVALNKLYLLMYLGMNYEAIRTKKLELILNNEKYNIETYPVDKNMVLDSPTVIFNDNDEFTKYYEAHVIYENYLNEENTQKKCNIINHVFRLYHNISEGDMIRYKSFPIWLHRFTPAYLYVKMLESGVQDLKKDKQNETALDVVTSLISQLAFRQHKKAGWYAEKALILHKLLGCHDEAAQVLTEGLKSNLSFEAKDAMRKRADLLANQKNIKLDELLKKELNEYATNELIMENKFKADHINKQHIESTNQRGKKKFKIETEDEVKYVDAEDYCVIHYTNEGPWTHAQHWEGRIITTIFFLLFWDIIYTKPRGVTGIFLSHYQVYPLDMYCESFYTNRKTLIDERLARIEVMTTVDMVEAMRVIWDERPEHELSGINRNISWDCISMVSNCLGSRHTAALCRRLATNYGYTHSGFPDLTLWNLHTGKIKFVEVKTDTDKPSIKQLQWMQYLIDNGIDTGFCYLGVNTTRCRARARDSNDGSDSSTSGVISRQAGRGRGVQGPEEPRPSLVRDLCPLIEPQPQTQPLVQPEPVPQFEPEESQSVPEHQHQPEPEPQHEAEPELEPEWNIQDLDVIIVGHEVELETQPSQSNAPHRTCVSVNDGHLETTIDDWMLDEDSDVDMDVDIDDDVCPLPVMRNALTEPACDIDLTALEFSVLQAEDDLNDRHLRNIVPSDDYYHFEWKEDRAIFTGQRETFTGSSGPTFDVTDKTPIDIFYKMFDNDFIDLMCTETNRYAEQKIASLKAENKLLPSSRLQRWTPTNRDEMIAFLAVLILQGLYPLPEEEKYFSFNGFGTMPYFPRIMSYNRFLLLKSLYHFVDSQNLTDRTKLCRIRPVIDYFNDKFSTLYMPGQEIAIDESLLKWYGRLSFTQKIATKAVPAGVKTYELCESRTGYLWRFMAYVEKKTAPTETNDRHDDMLDRSDIETLDRQNTETFARPDTETPEQPDDADKMDSSLARPTNATAKIVFELAEPLLHRGHTLIMDNFYNSPLLLRCLKRQKTDCYGTLRLNREFVPDSLKTLTKTDLRQGEVVARYSSDLAVMVWRDANLVSMISTFHHLQVGTQNKYNKLTYKPKIVLDYNKSMGGLDRKDRFLSGHPVERVRNKIWYKKVFCRLLNTAVFNSFIIFSTKNPKITHRNFRVTLAEDLLKLHRRIDLTTEPRLFQNKTGRTTSGTYYKPTTVDDDHFPARSNSKKGRCRMCTRRKRDTRTIWKCIQCDVSLCIEHCFREYHKSDVALTQT